MKKSYIVRAVGQTYYWIDIEADSEEEAMELAEEYDGSGWVEENDYDFNITSAEERVTKESI